MKCESSDLSGLLKLKKRRLAGAQDQLDITRQYLQQLAEERKESQRQIEDLTLRRAVASPLRRLQPGQQTNTETLGDMVNETTELRASTATLHAKIQDIEREQLAWEQQAQRLEDDLRKARRLVLRGETMLTHVAGLEGQEEVRQADTQAEMESEERRNAVRPGKIRR